MDRPDRIGTVFYRSHNIAIAFFHKQNIPTPSS